MDTRNTGKVIWFTGLSGSGKSVLACEIASWLGKQNKIYKILDENEIKEHIVCSTENIQNIISWAARILADCGIIVMVTAISSHKEERNKAKKIIGADRFIEIFVDCGIGKLIHRDINGLYTKALKGEIQNFTGISIPYERPPLPDVYINTGKENIQESVSKIIEFLIKKL